MAKTLVIHFNDEAFLRDILSVGVPPRTLLELGLEAYRKHLGPPLPENDIVLDEKFTITEA